MTKKQTAERKKFFESQRTREKRARENIKKILAMQHVSVEELRRRLAEMGFVKSQPTLYSKLRSPLSLDRNESNAIAKVLKLEPAGFDAVIQGNEFSAKITQNIVISQKIG